MVSDVNFTVCACGVSYKPYCVYCNSISRNIQDSYSLLQLLPKLLFPLFLHFLFWDPDNATPMSGASVEKAIDFLINPAIGVPRLYMISGLVRMAILPVKR